MLFPIIFVLSDLAVADLIFISTVSKKRGKMWKIFELNI